MTGSPGRIGVVVIAALTRTTSPPLPADNLAEVLSLLPILRTGEAIVVGEAVPLPIDITTDHRTVKPASYENGKIGKESDSGLSMPCSSRFIAHNRTGNVACRQ